MVRMLHSNQDVGPLSLDNLLKLAKACEFYGTQTAIVSYAEIHIAQFDISSMSTQQLKEVLYLAYVVKLEFLSRIVTRELIIWSTKESIKQGEIHQSLERTKGKRLTLLHIVAYSVTTEIIQQSRSSTIDAICHQITKAIDIVFKADGEYFYNGLQVCILCDTYYPA